MGFILRVAMTALPLLAVGTLSGCTLIKTGVALSHSREQFVATQADAGVRYAPGSQEIADRVAEAIQQSREIVEQTHGAKFPHVLRVFVCNAGCFTRYVPVNANEPAAQFGDAVFMNADALMKREQRGYLPLENILTHELAHLLLYQVPGAIAYARVPAWFREGIAQQVAHGAGGAEFCSLPEAVRNLLAGKHFDPAEAGSMFRNRTAPSYSLSYPVFYREALMFVEYLKETKPVAFETALHDVMSGRDFQDSFKSAYGQPIASFWPTFITSVKALAEPR